VYGKCGFGGADIIMSCEWLLPVHSRHWESPNSRGFPEVHAIPVECWRESCVAGKKHITVIGVV